MMSSGVTAGVYWLAGDARWRPPQDMTPLTSTVRADICIVGGGFTGLWAALTIKRLSASAEVVLVEREFCGSGAAGRNGGWVEGLELVVPAFIARFGEDAARWLLESSLRSMDDIGDAVRDGDVDCDFELGGGLIVATCKAHLSSRRKPSRVRHGWGERICSGPSPPRRLRPRRERHGRAGACSSHTPAACSRRCSPRGCAGLQSRRARMSSSPVP